MTVTAPPSGGRLGILFLVVFINLVGFGVILPVFPFFGSMVGASPTATTIAMAAYSLGQLIGAPLWGKVSDRIGRRPVLIWSLIGSLLSYFVMAVSHDIWTLGLARLFGGLMAGNIAAAFAYVGDMTDETSRPKAMGMIGAAFGLGFIFGPAIGGLIAGDTPNLEDFAQVCLAAAAITGVAAAAVWWKLPESLPVLPSWAVSGAKPASTMAARSEMDREIRSNRCTQIGVQFVNRWLKIGYWLFNNLQKGYFWRQLIQPLIIHPFMKKFILPVMAMVFTLATATAQDALPNITLKTLAGQPVNIQDYSVAGKTTIISFWATWCTPCKKELDAISKKYDQWTADYNVELVAVTIDDQSPPINWLPIETLTP